MNKLKITSRVLLCLGVCVSVSGCAELSSTPQWDASFGESYRQLIVLQSIHPDGVANSDAENGIDGVAAAAAQSRYGTSFEAPPAPVTSSILSIK